MSKKSFRFSSLIINSLKLWPTAHQIIATFSDFLIEIDNIKRILKLCLKLKLTTRKNVHTLITLKKLRLRFY